ncbi:hypothetical protein ABIE65_000548 [Constrictibacter sp. MBR-5]|jgi:hypothetical protein
MPIIANKVVPSGGSGLSTLVTLASPIRAVALFA